MNSVRHQNALFFNGGIYTNWSWRCAKNKRESKNKRKHSQYDHLWKVSRILQPGIEMHQWHRAGQHSCYTTTPWRKGWTLAKRFDNKWRCVSEAKFKERANEDSSFEAASARRGRHILANFLRCYFTPSAVTCSESFQYQNSCMSNCGLRVCLGVSERISCMNQMLEAMKDPTCTMNR